jgi:hypothetical protein
VITEWSRSVTVRAASHSRARSDRPGSRALASDLAHRLAICSSRGVSCAQASGTRRRVVSPDARNSCLARSAYSDRPRASKVCAASRRSGRGELPLARPRRGKPRAVDGRRHRRLGHRAYEPLPDRRTATGRDVPRSSIGLAADDEDELHRKPQTTSLRGRGSVIFEDGITRRNAPTTRFASAAPLELDVLGTGSGDRIGRRLAS